MVLSESFLSINFDFLLKFLESDDIEIISETDVFNSLKKWVDHDAYDRNRSIPALIEKIRLPLLSKTVRLCFKKIILSIKKRNSSFFF